MTLLELMAKEAQPLLCDVITLKDYKEQDDLFLINQVSIEMVFYMDFKALAAG